MKSTFWHGLKEVLIITFVVRLAVFLFSLVNLHIHPHFFELWTTWDSDRYQDIALNWYRTYGEASYSIVFYPFYPLLIKGAYFFLHNIHAASVVISTFFAFLAAFFLYKLARLDYKKPTALLAVWYFNIFPMSYFLQAGYSESVFLFLSIASVYFYRTKQPVLAGVSGMFAALTRVNGLLLLPMLLWERRDLKSLVGLALIPVGFIIYLYINFITFGDWFYFTKPMAEHWYKRLAWPWVGISQLKNMLPAFGEDNFYIFAWEIAALIFLVTILVYVWWKVRASYGVYLLANLLLFVSTSFILSTPRYLYSLFPIFIAMATIRSKILIALISIICIPTLFYLTYLFTQNQWAF